MNDSSLSALIAHKFRGQIHTSANKQASETPASKPTPVDTFARSAAKKPAHNLPPELLKAAQRYFGAAKAFAK